MRAEAEQCHRERDPQIRLPPCLSVNVDDLLDELRGQFYKMMSKMAPCVSHWLLEWYCR